MAIRFLIMILFVFVSGCSLMPYEENFACEKDRTFGKCVSVEGAYEEAVTGTPQGRIITKDGVQDVDDAVELNNIHPSNVQAMLASEDAAYTSYRQELYTQLRDLVSEPETPMIRKAEQNRTLILSYSPEQQKNRLYMPRYIYSIHRSAEFVLGQYKLEQDPSIRLLQEFLRNEEK